VWVPKMSSVPADLRIRVRLADVFRLFYRLLVGLTRLAVWTGRAKDLEIIVLRHQLAVLQRNTKPLKPNDHDRSFLAAIARALPTAQRQGWLITPDTLLRWHRRLIARHWTQPPSRRQGRPSTTSEIRKLVLQMADANPTWGYRRIAGELARLGNTIAPSTVWAILRAANIDPSPTRTTVSWTAFLRSQAAAACDFVTVDTAIGKRFYLFFFIDIPTRRVTLAGITLHPTGQWTTQAARNLFITTIELFTGCKMLVQDGAGQFTASFDEIFRTEGIRIAKTPPRTPVANCFIERWFGTLRRELLDRTIIWNETQLRRLIDEYVAHYNEHRPHRSLDQQPPITATVLPFRQRSPVTITTRCNGLIHEYRQAA
jgi:putative transposase